MEKEVLMFAIGVSVTMLIVAATLYFRSGLFS